MKKIYAARWTETNRNKWWVQIMMNKIRKQPTQTTVKI